MSTSIPSDPKLQHGQVISFLDAAFYKGYRFTKEMIQALCPDLEPTPPTKIIMKQIKGQGWCEATRVGFDAHTRKLMVRFSGYIPSYEQRELMKYKQCPPDDAPLEDWIKQFLNHAKSKWSGAIDGGEKRQFVDWLHVYLQDPKLRWCTGIESHEKAESLVRLSWGLTRFPPTVFTSKSQTK